MRKSKMLDEIAIQQTINRWSEGASRTDWEQMGSTLMPNAVWKAAAFGIEAEGIAAILGNLAALVAPMAYSVQLNAPGVITVNGDNAVARSVIRESGKYADRDEAFEILGFYSDVLVRASEGWKFSNRTFEAVAMRNFPLLPTTPAAL
jgi:ketosteroid isomerase-like protein